MCHHACVWSIVSLCLEQCVTVSGAEAMCCHVSRAVCHHISGAEAMSHHVSGAMCHCVSGAGAMCVCVGLARRGGTRSWSNVQRNDSRSYTPTGGSILRKYIEIAPHDIAPVDRVLQDQSPKSSPQESGRSPSGHSSSGRSPSGRISIKNQSLFQCHW